MPIYEYECIGCSLKFEYLVRSSHDNISCPGCNKNNLKRLISSFSFSSHDSTGNITASSSGGCNSCTTHNCSSCSG